MRVSLKLNLFLEGLECLFRVGKVKLMGTRQRHREKPRAGVEWSWVPKEKPEALWRMYKSSLPVLIPKMGGPQRNPEKKQKQLFDGCYTFRFCNYIGSWFITVSLHQWHVRGETCVAPWEKKLLLGSYGFPTWKQQEKLESNVRFLRTFNTNDK